MPAGRQNEAIIAPLHAKRIPCAELFSALKGQFYVHIAINFILLEPDLFALLRIHGDALQRNEDKVSPLIVRAIFTETKVIDKRVKKLSRANNEDENKLR